LPQVQAAKWSVWNSYRHFQGAKLVTSPKQLRASVTERRYRAPARTSWEVKMNIVPNQNLFFVFDDEAIRAMGTAFDQACRSLRHFAQRMREPRRKANH
jgi:hypothetical protein